MVHRGIMKLKTHNNMLGIPQIEKDIPKFFLQTIHFRFQYNFWFNLHDMAHLWCEPEFPLFPRDFKL